MGRSSAGSTGATTFHVLGDCPVRAIEYIVGSHPAMAAGEMVTVKPHDLCRTYAWRPYDAGFGLVAIQQNLGHADVKTTLGYIATLDAEKRKPPVVLCGRDLSVPHLLRSRQRIIERGWMYPSH